MTLRKRLLVFVTAVSLISAAAFSAVLLLVSRSALDIWENPAVERSVEISVAVAADPARKAEALQGFRAYHQLRAVKGLIEQRIVVAGVAFGVAVFLLSLAASSIALTWMTRPLRNLTRAIEQAGRGDLTVRVAADPKSETGTVAQAFNTMTARLRKLQDELRRTERLAGWRDVARVLGHEIRNPLTPVRLLVERLQHKSKEESPDLPRLVERTADTVLEEIAALERLVQEFSEFARLPRPEPKPTRLNHLLADVVAQYSASASEIDFRTDLDPAADEWDLDKDLIRRAFGNILKNSIEALTGAESAGRGQISVTTRVEERECAVTFTDNGPGIPTENITRVFDPYYTTKTKGSGLGLAVVRNIVAEHGGSVTIESAEQGTKVRLTIPREVPSESEVAGC